MLQFGVSWLTLNVFSEIRSTRQRLPAVPFMMKLSASSKMMSKSVNTCVVKPKLNGGS